jgi:hypothetical protein
MCITLSADITVLPTPHCSLSQTQFPTTTPKFRQHAALRYPNFATNTKLSPNPQVVYCAAYSISPLPITIRSLIGNVLPCLQPAFTGRMKRHILAAIRAVNFLFPSVEWLQISGRLGGPVTLYGEQATIGKITGIKTNVRRLYRIKKFSYVFPFQKYSQSSSPATV